MDDEGCQFELSLERSLEDVRMLNARLGDRGDGPPEDAPPDRQPALVYSIPGSAVSELWQEERGDRPEADESDPDHEQPDLQSSIPRCRKRGDADAEQGREGDAGEYDTPRPRRQTAGRGSRSGRRPALAPFLFSRLRPLAADDAVEAQWTRSSRCEIEEDEAVQDGRLSTVRDRPDTSRIVRDEIDERHLPTRDERHPGGVQTERDEGSPEEFDDAGDTHSREQVHGILVEDSEQFLRAVKGKREADDESGDRVDELREVAQWLHSDLPSQTKANVRSATILDSTARVGLGLRSEPLRGLLRIRYGRQYNMMRHICSRMLAAAAAVAMVVVPLGAQEAAEETGSWLHVQVEGEGNETGQMALNLPLRAVGAFVAMAPEEIVSSDGRLTVGEEHGVSVSEIRTMWQELMAAGDSEFAAVQRDDRTVRVARADDQIEINVTSGDANIRIDLPVVVIDALLSGDGETLNLVAAIDQLGDLRGDIVRVTEETRQIRIWVDESAEQ